MKKVFITISIFLIIGGFSAIAQKVSVKGASVHMSGNIQMKISQMDLEFADHNSISGSLYSNAKLLLDGDLLVNSSSNPFFNLSGQNGTFSFYGNSDSYIHGSISAELQNLSINKTTGALYLMTPVLVNGVLSLNNGILFSDNINLLSMGLVSSVGGGSNNSHVKGYMSKNGDAVYNSFIFPLGTGSIYRPIGFKNLNGPTTFTARHAENNPAAGWDTNPPVEGNEVDGSSIERISNVEYWELNKTGNPQAEVILSWDEAYSQVENSVYLLAAVYNNTELNWRNLGAKNFDLVSFQFESFNQTDMFGVFTLASSLLPALMGDVNNDGNVNVLDVVWMVNYITGSPNPGFVFENGDFDLDGNITTADLTALIDLIFAGSKEIIKGTNSEIAHLYIDSDGLVELENDGTITAVKFQFVGQGLENIVCESLVNTDHKISYNTETGMGVVYSMKNSAFEEGKIDLMKISDVNINVLSWGDAEASNTFHELVDVVTHYDNDATGITAILYENFNFVIYPNPSDGHFSVDINLPESTFLMVEIADKTGRLVHKTNNISYDKGEHNLNFDIASTLNSGVYFLRILEYDKMDGVLINKYEEKLIVVN